MVGFHVIVSLFVAGIHSVCCFLLLLLFMDVFVFVFVVVLVLVLVFVVVVYLCHFIMPNFDFKGFRLFRSHVEFKSVIQSIYRSSAFNLF